jgi:hypothetical protein
MVKDALQVQTLEMRWASVAPVVRICEHAILDHRLLLLVK